MLGIGYLRWEEVDQDLGHMSSKIVIENNRHCRKHDHAKAMFFETVITRCCPSDSVAAFAQKSDHQADQHQRPAAFREIAEAGSVAAVILGGPVDA